CLAKTRSKTRTFRSYAVHARYAVLARACDNFATVERRVLDVHKNDRPSLSFRRPAGAFLSRIDERGRLLPTQSAAPGRHAGRCRYYRASDVSGGTPDADAGRAKRSLGSTHARTEGETCSR